MFEDDWQLISRDKNDVFGVLREDEAYLITLGIKYYLPIQIEMAISNHGEAYSYQSRLHSGKKVIVLGLYHTKEEAIAGHESLAKKYNLR